MKTRKVFRIWKYAKTMKRIGRMDNAIESLILGWPQKCEGKTEKQMNKMGYLCAPYWLVEE